MRDGLNFADRATGGTRPRALALAALAGAVALALAASVLGPTAEAQAPEGEPRPNVVVIMTDDQPEHTMWLMDRVRSLLAARGTSFEQSFVNYPLCCPSRSTFLTGQYAHNHGVTLNRPPQGGYYKLNSRNTLPVWLKRAGYYTAHIGRYLNEYGTRRPSEVPPGYDEWHTSVDPSTFSYFSYVLNEGGPLVGYGDDPEDYNSDVYTDKAVELIGRRAPEEEPFFLWVSYLAPHIGAPFAPGDRCERSAQPAPRHVGALADEPLRQPPSFNELDVADKPASVQRRPLLDEAGVARLADRYRCRLESLLAVDEGVGRIVQALETSGELARTVVIFTSDNGFLNGEHRVEGKFAPYEEAIRVPLIMRGPWIPEGATVRELVSNVDLARTIAEVAGAKPRLKLDGVSLLPMLANPTAERGRALAIESNRYKGVRTRRYLYARYVNGGKELYDLDADPFELDSRHADPAYAGVRRRLARLARRLKRCSGAACHRLPHLRLRLRFDEVQFGEVTCAAEPIVARVGGRHRRELHEVRFHVDGKLVTVDPAPPFVTTLPFSEFRTGGTPTPVRATADFIDGRRKTVDRELIACR